MSIFQLSKEITFPPAHLAEVNGMLAVGGDLSIERLLLAYRSGIFPWYAEGQPLIWWSPDPRCILFPDDLEVSKSMQQLLKKQVFEVTLDMDFAQTIKNCKLIERPNQKGTWITDKMMDAYLNLHEAGFAHSVEVWKDKKMVGGLYGVSLGTCFFGESMFSHVSNASKVGFITLVNKLKALDFDLIDCQVTTEHLVSLGATEIPRDEFIKVLNERLKDKDIIGNWGKNQLFH